MYAILAFVGIFITIFLRFSFWRKKCCERLPGNGPSFFNVVGDVFEIAPLFSSEIHRDVQKSLREKVQLCRKDKLFCVWITYVPFVFLLKAETVKELLKNNKMNDKSWVYKWFEPAFGKGIVTSSAAKAKARRKLLMPCFHPEELRKHLMVFNKRSEELVDVLRGETNKEFTAIENFITLCTIDIIMETMFGITSEALKSRSPIYKRAIEKAEDNILSRLYKPWLWPSIIFWNSKRGNEIKRVMNFLNELTKKIVQDEKEYLKGEFKIQGGKRKALLEILLEKHIETQELSEEDIVKELNTVFLAGHETVATSVSWTLFLIGLHPDVQAKIHGELDEVFGEDVKRPVTEMDLRDLQYLDCVIKESARLYPAIPLIGRQANEDVPICNFVIPKGSSCVVPLYFLHRDEDVFPDPEKFDPERFSLQNRANIPEYAYIPFSAGPRSCIGHKYAEMELKTIMSTILRNFTVESLDKREELKPIMKIALHPSRTIRLKFRSRSGKN